MRTRLITLSVLALCIGLLAGHFWPNAAATAATVPAATSAVYYQTFAGNDFQTSDGFQTFTSIGGSVCLYHAGSDPMRKPLDLPSGATITNVTFYFVDNVVGAGLDFSLQQYDPQSDADPLPVISGSTSSRPDLPGIQSFSLNTNLTVDNSRYAYSLSAVFGVSGSTLRLTGARVTYTLPTTYLPLIAR